MADLSSNVVISHEDQGRGHTVVGTRPIRHDGPDKVVGRARYAADVFPTGLLHAKLLRSPHAHAVIKSIDATRALALPGVKAVATGADFPMVSAEAADQEEGAMMNYGFYSRWVMAREKALHLRPRRWRRWRPCPFSNCGGGGFADRRGVRRVAAGVLDAYEAMRGRCADTPRPADDPGRTPSTGSAGTATTPDGKRSNVASHIRVPGRRHGPRIPEKRTRWRRGSSAPRRCTRATSSRTRPLRCGRL